MIDRTDLMMIVTNETRLTKGHLRKIGKSQCSGDVKKFSLVEEIVEANSMLAFKKKLDEFRYGDSL